jgi:hypothetical protein
MKRIYLNPFLAMLLVTIFGAGATLFVLHAINSINFVTLAQQNETGQVTSAR